MTLNEQPTFCQHIQSWHVVHDTNPQQTRRAEMQAFLGKVTWLEVQNVSLGAKEGKLRLK